MTRRQVRGALALPVLGVLAVLLLWGFSGLPPFGNFHGLYGQLLNHIALPQRHTTNVVAAVVFDYRGFDTLGEEFILFAAVSGVVMLLRADDEQEPPAAEVESPMLRYFGVIAVGVVLLVGIWLVAFGLVTPGGGFQGGVILASGTLLIYLGEGYAGWRDAIRSHWLDALEGGGALLFALCGLAPMLTGAAFMQNILPLGTFRDLFSGGLMLIENLGVALAVTGGFTQLFLEFMEETREADAPEEPGEESA